MCCQNKLFLYGKRILIRLDILKILNKLILLTFELLYNAPQHSVYYVLLNKFKHIFLIA